MHTQMSDSLSASEKKNTRVLAQETTLPNININNYQLEVVDEFTLHT